MCLSSSYCTLKGENLIFQYITVIQTHVEPLHRGCQTHFNVCRLYKSRLFFCRIWIKMRDWTHKLSRKVCWSIKIRQESFFPIDVDWTEMFFAARSIAICWPSDRMQVQGLIFWPGSCIHIVILYSRSTKSCLIYFEEWYEWEKSKNDTPLLYVCKRIFFFFFT